MTNSEKNSQAPKKRKAKPTKHTFTDPHQVRKMQADFIASLQKQPSALLALLTNWAMLHHEFKGKGADMLQQLMDAVVCGDSLRDDYNYDSILFLIIYLRDAFKEAQLVMDKHEEAFADFAFTNAEDTDMFLRPIE